MNSINSLTLKADDIYLLITKFYINNKLVQMWKCEILYSAKSQDSDNALFYISFRFVLHTKFLHLLIFRFVTILVFDFDIYYIFKVDVLFYADIVFFFWRLLLLLIKISWTQHCSDWQQKLKRSNLTLFSLHFVLNL